MRNKIPTYIVNLKHRIDRKKNIIKEFRGQLEFEVHFYDAIIDKTPAKGLYKSLINIIKLAKSQNLPYLLFCEDDHVFTENFDFERFKNLVKIVNKIEADVLLGGVSWFDYGVKINSDLYWIDHFTGMQFSIIYSKFYDKILNTTFNNIDVIDKWISKLSNDIYLINPFISIQKDFGYSDVTIKNNKKGILDNYFLDMANKLIFLDSIYNHILNSTIPVICDNTIKDLQIPVYIINLKNNLDKLSNVLNEFQNRNEFSIEIVEACENENRALGLWMSIKKVIALAKEREDEVIIICEDNHVFTENYNRTTLFKNIYRSAYLGADIVLGGVSDVSHIVVVDENLCWISEFYNMQFIIIHNKFYDQILNEGIDSNVTSDGKFSEMSPNKYVIHPFISIQKNFGNSDNHQIDHPIKVDFIRCSDKIQKIKKISKYLKT
ncbi:hypothetical protein ACFRAE_17105 [Sphingobacterium sp. HJSM2_6]|uniref:hypothetical protein n=1 Tax=Sphingobacterium sp. HJSM2_6 TaxID=3366264 RepID=UPI003BC0C446